MHIHHRATLPTTSTAASDPMVPYPPNWAAAILSPAPKTEDASPKGNGFLDAFPDNMDDPYVAMKLLVPISVAAWVLVGGGCILCINGKRCAGRWLPKWYLDGEGTPRDKALVGAWWLAVLVLWPVILPVLLLRKIARVVRKQVVKGSRERRERDKGVGRATEV